MNDKYATHSTISSKSVMLDRISVSIRSYTPHVHTRSFYQAAKYANLDRFSCQFFFYFSL